MDGRALVPQLHGNRRASSPAWKQRDGGLKTAAVISGGEFFLAVTENRTDPLQGARHFGIFLEVWPVHKKEESQGFSQGKPDLQHESMKHV